MDSDLIDAWNANAAANDLILGALGSEDLEARYSPKTRTVASQFAHLHNVRISHTEARKAEGADALTSFARGTQPTKRELTSALAASSEVVRALFADCDRTGKMRAWSGRSAVSFLGYLISHESHHRGLVLVSLRLSGRKLDKDVTYGIWNWRKLGQEA